MLPTALVHGFGTSRHVWRRVVEAYPGALTPELPGFGDAAAQGRAGQTTGDMMEALAGALRAAGGGPYRVAGHSMGGKVALLLALRHPDLVGDLLLVAPSPPTPEPMTPEGRAGLRAVWNDPEALRRQYQGVTRQPLAGEDFAGLVRDGERANQGAWAAWPDVGSREDFGPEVARSGLTLPITVLFSEDDPAITAQTVRREVLGALPGARPVPIRGSGHFIPLEVPEAVGALLTPP